MTKSLLAVNLVIAFSAASILSGCYNDNAEELYPAAITCDTVNVTYAATIQPIIKEHCATGGCHAGPVPSGIDMNSFADLQTVAQNGKLLASVTHSGGANPMPKGLPKLDNCTIAKISKWVEMGAPDN